MDDNTGPAAAAEHDLPPIAKRGVDTSGPELSWLVATDQWAEDQARAGWDLYRSHLEPLWPSRWVLSGARHYSKGIRLDDWSVGCYWAGQGNAAGSLMLEVRQGALDVLTPAARLGLCLLPLRPRRLDVALDDRALLVRPSELFRLGRQAITRSDREKWRLEVGGVESARETLYVGSRQSVRMLRVYDKPDHGVRHEVELKDTAAEWSMARLREGWALSSVFWQAYRKLVEWPRVPGWMALAGL